MHIALLHIKLQPPYKSALNFSYLVDPRNVEPHCEWEFWKVESNSKVSSQRNIQPIWEWPETTGTEVMLKTQVWLSSDITEKLLNNHNCLCDYYCHNCFQPGWPKHITSMWWRVYSLRSQSVDPVGKRLQKDALDVRENGTVTGKIPVVQVQQIQMLYWTVVAKSEPSLVIFQSILRPPIVKTSRAAALEERAFPHLL